MTRSMDIWRQRLWIWAPALVFFLLNLAFFSTYRLVYAGQVESLEDRLAAQEQRLEEVRGERLEMETLEATARTNRQRLEELYDDRFATERERFTRVTSEIKELARRSGLVPSAISYPEEEVEDYGLVKRYFSFTVEGTYSQLRQFINLLELTPSFVTLEEVDLDGDEGSSLRIRLTLSTLFTEEPLFTGRSAAGGMIGGTW